MIKTAMARKVWFQLVARGGELFAGTPTTSVHLNDEVADIEDCSSNRTHAQYNRARSSGTNVLVHIGPSQLRIHANRAVYDDAKQRDGEEAYLRPSAPLGGLGRDAKDTLIVKVQRVWFLLVDASGKALSSGDRVMLEQGAHVVDLRNAVKTKCPNLLSLVDASQFSVFENRAVFNEK